MKPSGTPCGKPASIPPCRKPCGRPGGIPACIAPTPGAEDEVDLASNNLFTSTVVAAAAAAGVPAPPAGVVAAAPADDAKPAYFGSKIKQNCREMQQYSREIDLR